MVCREWNMPGSAGRVPASFLASLKNLSGIGGKRKRENTMPRGRTAAHLIISWFLLFTRMWGNHIGDEGAKAFAQALRNHPTLTNVR